MPFHPEMRQSRAIFCDFTKSKKVLKSWVELPILGTMKDEFKKTKLLAMALSAFIALTCFTFGAVWVRSLHDAMDRARLDDAGREIRSRMLVFKQLVVADMAALGTSLGNLPEQFDVAVVYSESRKYVAGLQRVGKDRAVVPLNAQLVGIAIPGDSAFFDRAASDGSASGLLVFAGRPLMVAVKRVDGVGEKRTFVLGGRWLDPRKLAPTAGLSEQAFDLFVPDDRASLPADIEQARQAMKSDLQFFGKIQRRGAGIGYLKFDDVFERTAFVLRFPWIDGGVNDERKSLVWLFVTSVLIGLILHFATALSLGVIEKQRRRSPGLSGMSDREFRDMTESFPGYAFAVNQRGEYVAMSRALAGVSGKESAYYVGRLFGSVSGEVGMSPTEIVTELSVSNVWPAIKEIDFSIAGLREQYSYTGSCHFIAGKRLLFVVLRANEQAQVSRVVQKSLEQQDTNSEVAA